MTHEDYYARYPMGTTEKRGRMHVVCRFCGIQEVAPESGNLSGYGCPSGWASFGGYWCPKCCRLRDLVLRQLAIVEADDGHIIQPEEFR